MNIGHNKNLINLIYILIWFIPTLLWASVVIWVSDRAFCNCNGCNGYCGGWSAVAYILYIIGTFRAFSLWIGYTTEKLKSKTNHGGT